MEPINYLCRAAQEAKAAKTNYVIAVRGSRTLARGTDLASVLTHDDIQGATLYSFRELTPFELGSAQAAGIGCVYYGVTRHIAKRLGLWPKHLEQRSIRYCRDAIVKEYVETWESEGKSTSAP
jgi:hypothetical protein